VGQVNVQVLYFAFINRFPLHLLGLKRRPKADGIGSSHIMVNAESSLGATDDPDLKRDAFLMEASSPLGESPGDSHRRPGRSKAADTQRRAMRDQFGGLCRRSQQKFVMSSHA
jgi:hypothetical protein